MTQPFDLEKYKVDQARARDLGFDYAEIRNIILQANSDEEDGISVGKAVELIREIGLRAVDKAVAEDRAALIRWLGFPPQTYLDGYLLVGSIERGEHRREEKP
jgi:hypothetical protein